MYKIQDEPTDKVRLSNGAWVKPIATLKDEYGGISHIIEDDHCYVLINGSKDRIFNMVYHWYAEAVEALKMLPSLKEE